MKKVVVLLIGLVFLSGCSRKLELLRLTDPFEQAKIEPLIQSLRAHSEALISYKILTKATITNDNRKEVLRYAVVADQAERLRIEALPLNGFYTLALLVANGSKVLFLDPAEKVAYLGTDPSQLIGRFFKVALKPEDLAALLVGVIPCSAFEHSFEVYQDKNATLVELSTSNNLMRFHVDLKNLNLVALEIRSPHTEMPLLIANYQGSMAVRNYKLPQLVSLNLLKFDTQVSLNLQTAIIEKPKGSLFEISIPDDYKLSRLSKP